MMMEDIKKRFVIYDYDKIIDTDTLFNTGLTKSLAKKGRFVIQTQSGVNANAVCDILNNSDKEFYY